ncbi:TetR/AcrR family transcriptional regulator [Phycicoccus sp. Soil802]|uniref:TetR/AcrR family transcriptional regulator n=1 Tax=Phycicoccus sp. Soil802 TaxID=1736414 RepID=UPI00138ECA28|nr:TetR/AcrR family transcriptional regulator C-terminal domain-containing protein [Phycicoccus sp. Soil802]
MGRPRTPLLSKDAIAMAALRLVDGTGEFTIAQVADALRVRPSSLYNHVSSKGEIVEAMRSLVFREGGVSREGGLAAGDSGPWEQTVRAMLRRYRECFARHQRLIPLVTAYTVSSPEVMGMYDELAETLRAADVPDGQLLDVITMCDSVVFGAALDLAAPDEVWAVDQARSPALIAAIQQAGSGRQRSDRAFDLALDILIAGIARLADGGQP